MKRLRSLFPCLLVVVAALSSCNSRPGAAPASTGAESAAQRGALTDPEKVLNVYNWADYIAPDLVPAFEREYGIKVNYDVFESNEVLETKLLTGASGYDIVVPTAAYLAREISAGVFRKLDKGLLTNLGNIDPEIARLSEQTDPGRSHGVNYLVSTMGVGYNRDKVMAAMSNPPVDSLAIFFDPAVIRNFASCGVTFVDAPEDVISTVLIYLGRPANSEKPEDLAAAEKVLMAIRPFVRHLDAVRYLDDLANGAICLALGWSGDVAQAAARAREAGNGNILKYSVPREGAILILDMFVIPVDAKHPKNAHLFMNYMLRPEVAARNSSYLHYQTSNAAAYPLVDPAVYNDRSIYPGPETVARLVPVLSHSPAYTRLQTRMWTRFKTGH